MCVGGPLEPQLQSDFTKMSNSLILINGSVSETGRIDGLEIYAFTPGVIIIYVSFYFDLNASVNQFINVDMQSFL